MLQVNENGTIQLTRGDTARLTVSIINDLTEEPYEIKDNDILKLTIKEKTKDENFVLQKVITGLNSFHIEPSDTKDFAFRDYVYDVELTTEDGDVFTVITPTTFKISDEVTY